jgi:hypothetical protein
MNSDLELNKPSWKKIKEETLIYLELTKQQKYLMATTRGYNEIHSRTDQSEDIKRVLKSPTTK